MVKLKNTMSFLNNVKILYLLVVLSILNLGYFLYNKDNQSIFLFAVMCLIVYFFNHNMIVVLLFSLITINLLIIRLISLIFNPSNDFDISPNLSILYFKESSETSGYSVSSFINFPLFKTSFDSSISIGILTLSFLISFLFLTLFSFLFFSFLFLLFFFFIFFFF